MYEKEYYIFIKQSGCVVAIPPAREINTEACIPLAWEQAPLDACGTCTGTKVELKRRYRLQDADFIDILPDP